jgi:hypothetical protein
MGGWDDTGAERQGTVQYVEAVHRGGPAGGGDATGQGGAGGEEAND